MSTPAERQAEKARAAALSAGAARGRTTATKEAAPRARTRNFGGPRLKLSVMQEIPGYHLYFENDEDGAIEQLLYEGFEFVKPDEVRMTSHVVNDADVTDRVSRFVGKKADGSPLRAYLLKCTDDIWADRSADRLQQADDWEDSIYDAQKEPGSGRYIPKDVKTEIDPNFQS